jgi:signal transduction histidine kinase
MPGKLRILFVEDVPEDMEIEERELRLDGLDFTALRVETREELARSLDDFQPGLVITDYSLPTLDGLTALNVVREKLPEVPFVFMSGTIGEERAIECLKKGATDYVVKGRPGGFVLRIRRALKEAEDRATRQRVEQQLLQAQKMEVVGRLAGGVAHDFNNLLTVINGYTELMLHDFSSDHPPRKNAEEVLKAGERAAALTHQLLAFSRRPVIAPAILNLNHVATEMHTMLRRLIGEDIDIVNELDPTLGNVKADRGQMEQVIVNLAVNARDAMPDGGRLTVQTNNVTLDENYAALHPAGTQAGPHIVFAVTDTGIGMDQETQSHLFEPFFTTKDHGKGTGLGLSTVYGIVKQSRGSIEVTSEPGKGTTFKAYFPRVDEPPPAPAPKTEQRVHKPGTETILLIEDSDTVRRLMVQVLTQQGYQLLAASDGEEAFRLLRQHTGALHMVITDVVLPKQLSGPEIAYQVTRSRPGVKVLFTSGYTDRGIVETGIPFLQKPFGPESLTRKVREVLETPA